MIVALILYALGLIMLLVAVGQYTGLLRIRRRSGYLFPWGPGMSAFCAVACLSFSATLTLGRLGFQITESTFGFLFLAIGVVATITMAFDLIRWYASNSTSFKHQADEFANETPGWKENPPRR